MIYLYNSLTKKKEVFEPFDPPHVGMYTCGPTVYNYVHIGNWRTYLLSDIVIRTLAYNGYNVTSVMNITDVGHLSGDNEGDADTGTDRMEISAQKEHKNIWDIAKYYTEDFIKGFNDLNILTPDIMPHATDHITEQISLITELEKKDFTYTTSDGLYFDTEKYEKAGHVYGKLSTLESIQEGARVKTNTEKKGSRDFALWKFSPKDKPRQMEWKSPWGVGFPGWHIECSAMSMKYLGNQFDLHLGGEDMQSTHHPNEIAQSEGATGKEPFVKYWLHGRFLQVDGGKMGKSKGNAYTISDIEHKGFNPLSFRYLILTAHYRSPLNFTWESLTSSENALMRLKEKVTSYISTSSDKIDEIYSKKITEAFNDDFNTSDALALIWQLIKDNSVTDGVKRITILDADKVLGLSLHEQKIHTLSIPDEVTVLVEKRTHARKEKNWQKADMLRKEIHHYGFDVHDTDNGPTVTRLI